MSTSHIVIECPLTLLSNDGLQRLHLDAVDWLERMAMKVLARWNEIDETAACVNDAGSRHQQSFGDGGWYDGEHQGWKWRDQRGHPIFSLHLSLFDFDAITDSAIWASREKMKLQISVIKEMPKSVSLVQNCSIIAQYVRYTYVLL